MCLGAKGKRRKRSSLPCGRRCQKNRRGGKRVDDVLPAKGGESCSEGEGSLKSAERASKWEALLGGKHRGEKQLGEGVKTGHESGVKKKKCHVRE